MAVVTIPAAAITILTFLGAHTTRQAIKKYGASAVTNAMKFMKEFKAGKGKKPTKASEEATNIRVQEAAKQSRQATRRSQREADAKLDPSSSGTGPLTPKRFDDRMAAVRNKLQDKNLTPKQRSAAQRQLENLKRIRSEGDLSASSGASGGKLNKGGLVDYRKKGLFK